MIKSLPESRIFYSLIVQLIVCAVMHPAPAAASDRAPVPMVDLDATSLTVGPLKTWANAGAIQGEFAALDNPPVVAETAGRRAVRFEGCGPLHSSFVVPEELVANKPFTICVWAYVVQTPHREVVASWASRPNGTAEFSYGVGTDGAFFGWDRSVRYANLPTPAAWHHLAWTYDGKDVCVYVDGSADSRIPGKLQIKTGGRILLGAGWDGVGKKATFSFTGALSRVQIWPQSLSLREIRNGAGWKNSFAPNPADAAIVSAESLKLSWLPGSDAAVAYDVRLAGNEAMLADASTTAQRVTSAEFLPRDLTPGRKVYWRVDEIDAMGQVIEKGKVWSFSTDTGPASSPLPRNRSAGVAQTLQHLQWTPGRYATAQTLFFGTDSDEVQKGTGDRTKLDAKTNSFMLSTGRLQPGTTYYWRVDQNNGTVPPAAGEVWAFRTQDERVKNDVTFFVSSDTHYGLGNNDELNRKVIDEMNWLPGKTLPGSVGGGIVRTPRGVILCGDLLDKGFEPKSAPSAWAEFVADYGLTGAEGRLAYPVYEGFGNHDGMTGKSFSRAGIKTHNPNRVGLTAISSNGYHYSWDWDHVHLVQLNLFPGKDSADCIVGPPNHHPENSLDFLKEDLAKNVGSSDKIVIVFCHYCYSGGMADWWTDPAKDRFRDVVKGYRTLLIHGHSHGAYFYVWKGLRAISDGSTARPDSQTGDFLVVHITHDDLSVAQRKLDGWGITLKEPLPAADRSAADQKLLQHN